jgi:hypothetical protein
MKNKENATPPSRRIHTEHQDMQGNHPNLWFSLIEYETFNPRQSSNLLNTDRLSSFKKLEGNYTARSSDIKILSHSKDPDPSSHIKLKDRLNQVLKMSAFTNLVRPKAYFQQ